MVTKELYLSIAKKYGKVASWAVWDKTGVKPKSNISNMDVLDLEKNPSLLNVLRTDVIMVALNFSRDVEEHKPFLNFHDSNPYGQDFKIRYAFEGTEFYGAYMTDIIKGFPELSSKKVLKYLKDNPSEVHSQIDHFLNELKFIGAKNPVILAFGKDTYEILKKNLQSKDYSKLIALTHYSHRISKEKYRVDIHKKLGISG